MARKPNLEAKQDLETYNKGMMGGNSGLCLLVERKYGLDGYPPSVVTAGLTALAEGRNMGKAIDAATGY